MKILMAPNAFKGSLCAVRAVEIMAEAARDALPQAQILTLPVADGGDGLLEVLAWQGGCEWRKARVRDPLGESVEASFFWYPEKRLAVIESAEAIGLRLLGDREPDPMSAGSQGLGELILAALELGAREVVIGLGGSATNDGGLGLAQALGCLVLDAKGQHIPGNGAGLVAFGHLDVSGLDTRLRTLRFRVLVDVANPLLGPGGATAVYGPQKGVMPETQVLLEAGMKRLVQDFLGEAANQAGAGAAGGLGAMLNVLLAAELVSGSAEVLELLGFDEALRGCDLVLTTEGRLDAQSLNGKAPARVAARAKQAGIPCIALVGELALDGAQLRKAGFISAFSLCPGPVTLKTAQLRAADFLKAITQHVLATAFLQTSNSDMTYPSSIKKCVFPAAGYGTRFLPATKAMPKEMLPILDKPLIQYGVEEAMEAGMLDIGIITGRSKRAVEDHFDISYELEHQISGTSKEALLSGIRRIINDCTFSYTRQMEMKGLGHAILTAETLVGHEPFGVILADDLCINDQGGEGIMRQMLRVYEKYRCSLVAIEEVPEGEVSKYGIIDGAPLDEGVFKVNKMVEKPSPDQAPSRLAVIGRYILTPEIFDIIRRTPPGKNGEIQITDALQTQARENMVLAYQFKGRRFDCGSLEGFVEATNYFYHRYQETK